MPTLGALAARVALVLAVLALAGCQASLDVFVEVDRDGSGLLELSLRLDRSAQVALGLGDSPDPQEVAERFEVLLVEGGWLSDPDDPDNPSDPGDFGDPDAEGPIAARLDDRTGEIVLTTHHRFDSLRQLERLLSEPRPIAEIAPDEASLAAVPDLPASAPLLNEFRLDLGEATGDNPGFELFARAGVGELGSGTCQDDEAEGFARSLREALAISFRFSLPGGPGTTNADETPGTQNIWRFRFGDCPALQATSGGGSSSTLVNGAILAGLAGLLLFVFAVRALRRRRGPPRRR